MDPTELVDWFQHHWAAISIIAAVGWAGISAVVALTPSQEDDKALARVAQRISFFKPANVKGVLSAPGMREEAEPEA